MRKDISLRVLIIGGTSFIGPHIVIQLLEMNHQVAVFHRGESEPDLPDLVKHIHGHLRELTGFRQDFQGFKPDVILHMIAGDAQSAWTLVRTFKGIAKRVVVISSQDVYRAYNCFRRKEPGPPAPIPLSEDAPLRGKLFPYRGESFPDTEDPERRRSIDDYEKILVERIVMSEPDLSGTVLRLPAVYGPNDPQHRLFEYLKRMDDNRPAILMEDGAARWRWTRGYVENVAVAIVLALTNEQAKGKIYNVGEADALTQQQWVKAIGRAAGWKGEVLGVPKKQLPDHLKQDYDWQHHWVADTSRVRKELGYREIVSRAEAIRSTVAWERAKPPREVDPSKFDYAAEDIVLRELGLFKS
jgi:nucleoside-diphosphate-sugar epimerase